MKKGKRKGKGREGLISSLGKGEWKDLIFFPRGRRRERERGREKGREEGKREEG